MLLAGPDISSRLQLQLAMRIDEIAIRRRMHGSLRFRSAQELADRLVVRFLSLSYSGDKYAAGGVMSLELPSPFGFITSMVCM